MAHTSFMGGAPQPAPQTQPPTWEPSTPASRSPAEPREKRSGHGGNAWDEFERESHDLFGNSPAEIINQVSEFVESSRDLGRAEKQAAYLKFSFFIYQCGN